MARDADWDRPAEELFLRPGIDAGLWLVDPPRPWWRAMPAARIHGAAVAVHPGHGERIESHVATHRGRRSFAEAVETATQLVVAEDVEARGGALRVGGRHLLTGAAGTRLRNLHVWETLGRRDADAEARAALHAARDADPAPPPRWEGGIEGLDLVLDARNGYAFFHLLTETLGHLGFAERPDFTGRVVIQVGGGKLAGFPERWIAALHPALAARVELRRRPWSAARALTVLNGRHLHAQTGPRVMPTIPGEGAAPHYWRGRDADRGSLAVLAMNGADEGLRRLRAAALARIAGGDWSHLPRRFWIARRAGGEGRDRPMRGEAALFEALAARGFAKVHFEDLAPLEQVAAMHRAEVAIGYHGAGFANMAFAGADTRVVELGTLQTCLHRWQDFMPHAHVAGCRYVSLFADLDVADREGAGLRSAPLEGVALEPGGQARVLDYVDAVTGRARPVADPAWLLRLALLLSETGEDVALRGLLGANRAVALRDPDLTIQLANLAEADGDAVGAAGLLEKAWLATGDRPFLLERLAAASAAAGLASAPWEREHARLYPARAGRLRRRLRRAGGAGDA